MVNLTQLSRAPRGTSVLKTGNCSRDDKDTVGTMYTLQGVSYDAKRTIVGFLIEHTRPIGGVQYGFVGPLGFNNYTLVW